MKFQRDPNSTKEFSLGCLIFGGVIVSVLGVVATLVLYLGGSLRYLNSQGSDPGLYFMRGLGPAMIILGFIMTVVGLIVGIRKAKNPTSGKGIQKTDTQVRVLGKFAYRKGNLLTESWQWEGFVDVEFYVKLEMSDHRILEFQCAEQTYDLCGDGMYGEAVYDGRWLGRFTAYIGGAPMPRDPFTDK